MKNLETNRKLMANGRKSRRSEHCIWNLFTSSVAEDANKTRQVHLTFEFEGAACQNTAGNHHIRGQKKIAFSFSDAGGTMEKIKQPKTLI